MPLWQLAASVGAGHWKGLVGHLSIVAMFACTVPCTAGVACVLYESTWMSSILSFFTIAVLDEVKSAG